MNTTMLALKWRDRSDVHMLSTMHGAELAKTEKMNWRTGEKKPNWVLKHNKKMELVDKVDMQLSFSEIIRKTMKWNKFFFSPARHVAAQCIYSLSWKHRLDNKICRVQTANSDPTHWRTSLREQTGKANWRKSSEADSVTLHSKLPPSAAQGSSTQRRCRVCANTPRQQKRCKDTRYVRIECNKALCVEPHFKDYYTLKKYQCKRRNIWDLRNILVCTFFQTFELRV